jgi:CRP-like cAMP-binding protein
MVASRIATIPFGRLRDLSGSGTAAIQPLWRDILVQDSIAREWIANIGQRRAYQRIAHLLCEMRARLDARPIGGKVTFPWPVSQAAIGDATGMSVVHVNRVLQRLRIERLVVMRDGIVEIQDLERMEDMAGFDPSYLHLRPALDKEDRMTVSRPRVING